MPRSGAKSHYYAPPYGVAVIYSSVQCP